MEPEDKKKNPEENSQGVQDNQGAPESGVEKGSKSPQQEIPAVDEDGVPYKNRYREMQRKYEKMMENKVDTGSEDNQKQQPRKFTDEQWDEIERVYGIDKDVDGGIVNLIRDMSSLAASQQVNQIQSDLNKYKVGEAKREAMEGKSDFSKYSEEIDNYISTLTEEQKADPATLSKATEMAYWAAKGKDSTNSPTPNNDTSQQNKMIANQPEDTSSPKPSSNEGKKLTAKESEIAAKMGVSEEEYVKHKTS